jgi:hypothetical protein
MILNDDFKRERLGEKKENTMRSSSRKVGKNERKTERKMEGIW